MGGKNFLELRLRSPRVVSSSVVLSVSVENLLEVGNGGAVFVSWDALAVLVAIWNPSVVGAGSLLAEEVEGCLSGAMILRGGG